MTGYDDKIGIVGVGTMGTPIATNLMSAGYRVGVWNRTVSKTSAAVDAGATAFDDVDELFSSHRTILLVLSDSQAVDQVLGRRSPAFPDRATNHLIMQIGTVPPAYSAALSKDVKSAGGAYFEASICGSRRQAESKSLVGLIAGEDTEFFGVVQKIMAASCKKIVLFDRVPSASYAKIAVNIAMIPLVTGLAEAMHFAGRCGVRAEGLLEAFEAGPMACETLIRKAGKLSARDFTVEASIKNIADGSRMIVETARASSVDLPLLERCAAMYAEADRKGFGNLDIAAVVAAVRERCSETVGGSSKDALPSTCYEPSLHERQSNGG